MPGNNVRAYREGRGWRQIDLAVAVGVSRQTIISLEGDDYEPKLGLALKIAQVFGTTVEEMFDVQ